MRIGRDVWLERGGGALPGHPGCKRIVRGVFVGAHGSQVKVRLVDGDPLSLEEEWRPPGAVGEWDKSCVWRVDPYFDGFTVNGCEPPPRPSECWWCGAPTPYQHWDPVVGWNCSCCGAIPGCFPCPQGGGWDSPGEFCDRCEKKVPNVMPNRFKVGLGC